MFTKENLEQIQNQGLTIEIIEKQLNNFKDGFPPIQLIAPATPQNGLKILLEEEEGQYVSIFENSLSAGLNTIKFVPASGAASRMFKNLFEYLENNQETDFIQYFFDNLERFAFYPQLKELINSTNKTDLVKKLLYNDGLGYGNKPKGLITFHKYNNKSRTPFEEHLVEAASYCSGSDGLAKVHFTISPEHQEGFKTLLNNVKSEYQKRFGIQLDVTFSFQKKSTDTIAATMNNEPFFDNNRELIFRPGGHGALINNLNELDTDLIFIKNIDNVIPDRLKHYTKQSKKALAGLLVSLRNKIFNYLEKLDRPESAKDEELLKNIELFLKRELSIHYDFPFENNQDKIIFFHEKLNRPIRICGMVKNEGDPGGGPFWTKNADRTISLQIVEKAQIDLKNPTQRGLLSQSTHFNPVDLICSTKNYHGDKFDLLRYTDSQTGFISIKSKNGIEMKALELPGLWNGAMSDWNTIFVEVPSETFSPVKTINDLLLPEHQ